MKQVHLVVPYMREQNKDILLDAYRPMNVILHPIMFEDEPIEFRESWIFPCVIPMSKKQDFGTMEVQNVKRNWFIEHEPIIDDDYYVAVDDDDMYESGVFDEIKKMDDDIVIISMKRGNQTPKNVTPDRKYPTNTLLAHPDNVKVGDISNQQSFVKGNIFKKYLYDDQEHCADGRLAVRRKDAGEQIAYRPDLFALFNFYEPGRWEKGLQVSFGVMVNDPLRLNMVLQQSKFPKNTKCHFIKNPESATKGLNFLLDKIAGDGADVGILTHQDMYYGAGWIDQVKDQLSKLPDNWLCAGIIGKDMQGRIAGQFHDMRIPLDFNTKHIHKFPQPACCFDECCLIFNMKKGFRFEESFEGFDLYGTLCVLEAWEAGCSAWVIDAYAQHYCMRSFGWYPSDLFIENYKMLYDKYKNIRVDSTALGLPPDGELIFETSAAIGEEKKVA